MESVNDNGTFRQRRSIAVTISPVDLSRNEAVKIQPLAQVRARKKYKHVAVVHSTSRTSCLSHESQEAPSFLGFRNLMVLVLTKTNTINSRWKSAVNDGEFQKSWNASLQRVHGLTGSFKDIVLGMALLFIIPCHLFLAYVVELIAAQQARVLLRLGKERKGTATPGGSYVASDEENRAFQKTWSIIAWIHGINASLCLLITSVVVYFFIQHPLIGTLSEVHALIVWLKTASYGLTNRDLRHLYLHPSNREADALPELYKKCAYPWNISLSNLIYFWWAPTLVYQPVYPRTPKIRWIFVAKRLAEVFGLNVFIWIASVQYATPVLRNSLDKIATLDFLSILERLMKLSTISLVIWLAGFFALFQSYLNALAEIMRFGDREFYTDWWNSRSRHIYTPLRGRGWGSMGASLAVFLFSAIMHELLVGIPTHNIIGVAFMGMILQLPLIVFTAPLEKMKGMNARIIGNCIFWVSFTVIGQPLAALLYFFAWQAKYGSTSRPVIMSKI
ncbi:hypothetical protein Golomagni_04489 [Golovinomyces magnicellulatus]|nr:hypothetical protein Golomagni_04489 [Golovinomyces magnicellulatus]